MGFEHVADRRPFEVTLSTTTSRPCRERFFASSSAERLVSMDFSPRRSRCEHAWPFLAVEAHPLLHGQPFG